MESGQNILLPGGTKQLRILKNQCELKDKKVLIIGSGSEKIGEKIFSASAAAVNIIVNDFESLMTMQLSILNESSIELGLMEFDKTDFLNEFFDIVYAQASVSSSNRSKIVKEVKRILKPDGIFCVGEITILSQNYPILVKDIFDSSDLSPLMNDAVGKYYLDRNFQIILEQDLTSSLKSFYENAVSELKTNINSLTQQEKSYYKKMLNKISHESNAYLNLGADDYIGFKILILKKQ